MALGPFRLCPRKKLCFVFRRLDLLGGVTPPTPSGICSKRLLYALMALWAGLVCIYYSLDIGVGQGPPEL